MTDSSALPVSQPNVAPVLALNNLTKRFPAARVLRGVTLSINPGEVYGFIGRNGAGKSTCIKILMGILPEDAGEVSLFGVSGDRKLRIARQRVGYVAQEQHFYQWMTPKHLQDFVSGFYPNWSRNRYEDLIDRFELPRDYKIGSFSGGMKARLALCMALATQPELLVLDEPTAGMDPVARREFLDLVNEHAVSGNAAVLFSTHVMEDIESLATRVGVLERGTIEFDGTLNELEHAVAAFSIDELAIDVEVDTMLPEFSMPVDFKVLQRQRKEGRHIVVVRFSGLDSKSVQPVSGWRAQALSLEDRFVAMVATPVSR